MSKPALALLRFDLSMPHVDKPDCDACTIERAMAHGVGVGWALALKDTLGPPDGRPFPKGIEDAEKLVSCSDADRRRALASIIYESAVMTWRSIHTVSTFEAKQAEPVEPITVFGSSKTIH